ncbi:WD domain, G-beta repeat [Carpediemonas membranifera]|uniref:WD domain, G-beta repeat n=1 Tax=Carpediemonas membranifera TaxID=201153 RepID=A0A8J6AX66_9EUKA|nr:WD domain, G-beta repeat [Carpediemonas membranifera]|eukprot:KAG9390558.1 WD domain, G-beta repeat [Carpediemonas membranifera]
MNDAIENEDSECLNITTEIDANTVKVFMQEDSLDRYHETQVIDGTVAITAVAMCPDGSKIARGGDDGSLRLYSAWGALLFDLSGHAQSVTGLSFSPEGNKLASCSLDGTARLWNPTSGQCMATYRVSAWLGSASFSSDGRYLVTAGGDRAARVWDTMGLTNTHVFATPSTLVALSSAVMSPSGAMLVTGDVAGTIRVYDTQSGLCQQTMSGHRGEITGLAFTQDDRVVSAAWDRKIRVWNPVTGKRLASFSTHTDTISGVLVAATGDRIVSASYDGTVRMWSYPRGKLVAVLDVVGYAPTSVAMASGVSKLVVGTWSGSVEVFESGSGQLLSTLAGHSAAVTSVAVAPDTSVVVTGSWDETARVWAVPAGRCLRVLRGHTDCVWAVRFPYSADSRTLVSTASLDSTVRVWGMDGRCLLTARTKAHSTEAVRAVLQTPQILLDNPDAVPDFTATVGPYSLFDLACEFKAVDCIRAAITRHQDNAVSMHRSASWMDKLTHPGDQEILADHATRHPFDHAMVCMHLCALPTAADNDPAPEELGEAVLLAVWRSSVRALLDRDQPWSLSDRDAYRRWAADLAALHEEAVTYDYPADRDRAELAHMCRVSSMTVPLLNTIPDDVDAELIKLRRAIRRTRKKAGLVTLSGSDSDLPELDDTDPAVEYYTSAMGRIRLLKALDALHTLGFEDAPAMPSLEAKSEHLSRALFRDIRPVGADANMTEQAEFDGQRVVLTGHIIPDKSVKKVLAVLDALHGVRSSAVPRLLFVFQEAQVLYTVTEAGGAVRLLDWRRDAVFKRGTMTDVAFVRIARELLEGVQALHRTGIYHMAISAAGVTVTANGSPRLPPPPLSPSGVTSKDEGKMAMRFADDIRQLGATLAALTYGLTTVLDDAIAWMTAHIMTTPLVDELLKLPVFAETEVTQPDPQAQALEDALEVCRQAVMFNGYEGENDVEWVG